MRFTPRSASGRPVCEALEAFEQSRPAGVLSDRHRRLSHLLVFALGLALWMGTLVAVWVLRKEPRLRAVRPFFVNATFVASQVLFSFGLVLNAAIPNLPCGFMLFCCVVAVAGFGINYILRSAVYSVETQFALKVGQSFRRKIIPDEDAAVELAKFEAAIRDENLFTRFQSVYLVSKLALGLTDASRVRVEHLSVAKRSFDIILAVLYFPAGLCFILIMALVPPYQKCSGCSIFHELTISLAIVASLNVLIGLRVIYVCWERKFADAHGIFEESVLVILLVVPIFLVSGLMLMFDPNQLQYNNQMSWEWVMEALMLVYWWLAAGKHIVHILKAKRELKRIKDSSSSDPEAKSAAVESNNNANENNNSLFSSTRQTLHKKRSSNQQEQVSWLRLLLDDENLRAEFEKYAIEHYAVESVHFVLDVYAYKRFFDDKGLSWRKQKIRYFLETYIRTNSVMEVNVSYEERLKIVHKAESLLKDDEETDPWVLKDLFDVAVNDIVVNILRSLWVAFKAQRHKKKKKNALSAVNSKNTNAILVSAAPMSSSNPRSSVAGEDDS